MVKKSLKMYIKIFVLLAFCFLCVSLQTQNVTTSSPKLLLLQMLFRHGDRAPDGLYPTDPNPESYWVNGLSSLTQRGKRQLYMLGNYLRQMYSNFVTSSPREVKVNSTDFDRCLRSAECLLASFYRPTEEWIFYENTSWQPIPIYYKKASEDLVLNTGSYCPGAPGMFDDIKLYQKYISKNQQMYDDLTPYSGVNGSDWQSLVQLGDTLYIENLHNLTIPAWAEPYMDTLSEQLDLFFYLAYRSKRQQRLRAGPFIGELIENMRQKIKGETPDLKVRLYASHDANIAVLLIALKVSNKKRPPYASAVLVELYEMPEGQHTVRFLYQNSTDVSRHIDPPHLLILEGCDEYCPLEFFINYTKNIVPDDIYEECNVNVTTATGETKSFV